MRVMPARTLNTVVFVDIVESTSLAATIGDGPWASLLERFQGLVRRELQSTGGDEMDNAGDGFFAVFSDPAASVSFSRSIVRAVEALGLRVRVGIHTGTCWVAGEKCSGLTVNVGARIVAAAEPNEVLVSGAVKEHLAGDPRVEFRGRGEAELKGVPGSWSLYAVVDRAGGRSREVAPRAATEQSRSLNSSALRAYRVGDSLEGDMSQPLVYVDTSEVRAGKLPELKAAIKELAEFVDENEPQLVSYSVYFAQDDSRMTVMHVHSDSASLDYHMAIAGPLFEKFADLVTLTSIHIYGEPSERALRQLRDKLGLLGAGDVILHAPHAGFLRTASPTPRSAQLAHPTASSQH